MSLDDFLSAAISDCINGASGSIDRASRAMRELESERAKAQREADEFRAEAAKAKAEGDPFCAQCVCRESQHIYSGPLYSSSDGLPSFEGCFGEGSRYSPWDTEHDYPIPVCPCKGFEMIEDE